MNPINAIGYEQLSQDNVTASGLTFPTGRRPTHALIYNSHATLNLRWRADGTDPTTSTGMVLKTGTFLDLTDPMGNYLSTLEKIKFIAESSTITLEIIYFD